MIFIDTGAFLARHLAGDQYHNSALECWKGIINSKEMCFTSNFILDETFTLMARKAGYAFAAERAENVYASKALTILRPSHEEEVNALTYFKKYADQRVSFTDCVSFVLMRRHRIQRVFSFDLHFSIAGFQIYPPQ